MITPPPPQPPRITDSLVCSAKLIVNLDAPSPPPSSHLHFSCTSPGIIKHFRRLAAVFLVRHEQLTYHCTAYLLWRTLEIVPCLPLEWPLPPHNTKLLQSPKYQHTFCLERLLLVLSYLVRYLIHHCLELASLGIF